MYKATGKRGHIVAHDAAWAAQTGKHLLRTQNVSEQNQKHFFVSRTRNLCPQQILRARANRQTFVSATMFLSSYSIKTRLEDRENETECCGNEPTGECFHSFFEVSGSRLPPLFLLNNWIMSSRFLSRDTITHRNQERLSQLF